MKYRTVVLSATWALFVAGVARPSAADEGDMPTLGQLLAAGREHSPDNREARALAKQRAAEGSESVDQLLPTFTASAGYTRNQYEVVARFPNSAGVLQQATITPKNQLDATLALNVPLIDLGNFGRISSARAEQRSSEAQALATADTTSRDVGQAYYQLVAAEAVIESAERALSTSEENLATVESRRTSGLASDLDAHRARAEIERNRQSVADAELLRNQAARKLRTLTGLNPRGRAPRLPDDTNAEAPLEAWLDRVDALPAVRAAKEHTRGAEALHDAAVSAYLPTIGAKASERFTNAVGFGYSPVWAAGITANWTLDFAAVSAVHAENAAVEVAVAQADRARQAARDAIEDAHDQVETERERVVAARAQEDASHHAADVAKARYLAGTATQLDLVEAERDAFSAEVSRVQTEADLAYARFALRVAAGRALEIQ
ncbi:MAG TPA: TolC family protein [Polyangiaceae bacterium]|jgi:outer membrane protein TolC|nr:TolC family protein [Polyangiaceae bacterium]